MEPQRVDRLVPTVPEAMSGRRLLILDDEPAILLPLSHYFTKHGYTVSTSQEPEEAEALLECEHFDLVILDLALTHFGREGLEVLGSIHAKHPWLPVIIFSANVSTEVQEEAIRLGADAVLSKPQPLATVLSVADRMIGKQS
jgi:DNA-binding response OmpR family regulator